MNIAGGIVNIDNGGVIIGGSTVMHDGGNVKLNNGDVIDANYCTEKGF